MILDDYLQPLPLVPILRGIAPAEVPAVTAVLLEEGYRLLEVPLNSPEPFKSIEIMVRHAAGRALVGAGTVLDPAQVGRLAEVGGKLAVMPHSDVAVIREAKRRGLLALPGVATPTEAFAALAAGADALKLFPAEMMPPAVVKALLAVLPKGCRLFPVGGIAPETMARYRRAGVAGFGIGSAIYTPGKKPEEVRAAARAFAAAWRALER